MNRILEKKNIVHILKICWGYLSPTRKRQLNYLFILTIISSFTELVSLSAIYPFLSFLVDPTYIKKYPIIKNVADLLNIRSNEQLLIGFTTLYLISIVIAAIIKIFFTYYSYRISAITVSELGAKAYKKTINRSYSYHLLNNSNSLLTTIVKDIDDIIYNVFIPITQLISGVILNLSVIILLLYINLSLTIFSLLFIGLFYFLATKYTSNKISILSKVNLSNSQYITKLVQETLGSISEIILSNNQNYYYKKYSEKDISHRKNIAMGTVISIMPKLIIEPLGILSLAIIGFYLVNTDGLQTAIPTLGLISFCVIKVLPYSQRIFEGITSPRLAKSKLLNLLKILQESEEYDLNKNQVSKESKLNFHKLELKDIKFRYSVESPMVLGNLNLEIFKGDKIGIVGRTGSGKSTIVNIVNGLLKPSYGDILINEINLYSNENIKSNLIQSWQKSIIYVPQNIFLSDCTIAENIALGLNIHDIDYEKIEKVTKISQLTNDIEKGKFTLHTLVGERGIRLSGGQKQRIGIARALYKESKFILLDEATSALDNSTEGLIMESIKDFDPQITILVIAHRINTLKYCNKIFELNDGVLLRKA